MGSRKSHLTGTGDDVIPARQDEERAAARHRWQRRTDLHDRRHQRGQVCNTNQSVYADDDGGYLRMRAREYYLDPTSAAGIT